MSRVFCLVCDWSVKAKTYLLWTAYARCRVCGGHTDGVPL